MKSIEELKKIRSLNDFPDTAEEFLDYLLEDEAFDKKEPYFTYEQMKDFASVFALVQIEKQQRELEQYLKEFQYSQKPLLQITDVKVIEETIGFMENERYPEEFEGRSLLDILDEEDLPF